MPSKELTDHLTALAEDADKHDETCADAHEGICISNRWYTAAVLMNYLDLTLADLGHIAEAWLDLQCEIEPCEVEDGILDAKEIGE